MALVEHAGIIRALPESALACLQKLHTFGEVAIQAFHPDGDRLGVFAEGDKVDVVRHQAVAEDLHLPFFGIAGEEFEVLLPIFVVAEDVLPAMAALRDVQPIAGRGETGDACHSIMSSFRAAIISKIIRR